MDTIGEELVLGVGTAVLEWQDRDRIACHLDNGCCVVTAQPRDIQGDRYAKSDYQQADDQPILPAARSGLMARSIDIAVELDAVRREFEGPREYQ